MVTRQEELLIENKTIKVRLSIGISLYPKDAYQPLIEKADSAMYDVKNMEKIILSCMMTAYNWVGGDIGRSGGSGRFYPGLMQFSQGKCIKD